MSISRDRVRFKLDPSHSCTATRKAFEKAFGQSLPTWFGQMQPPKTIICRPSQFARFLIYRNTFGGKNGFKELEPELFTPCIHNLPLDVSVNPRSKDDDE